MVFPEIRMRNRRKDEATREQYRETDEVSPGDMIQPLFVREDISEKKEIKSMPGVYQFPPEEVSAEARHICDSGISSVILFGIPAHKDEVGSGSYDEEGVVQKAIRSIKNTIPELTVIGDVCMCEYTSHGHCGILKQELRPTGKGTQNTKREYDVDNDETIKILAKIAVSYAEAGADIVAPSAMMDGQVKTIKEALTTSEFSEVRIMSYSTKYASGFYGPFRDAAGSPPQFGDRKTYQMDFYNSDEGVLEAKLDIEEGADILMVKPALAYQDVIYRIKKELDFPLACYSVSGEYAMIKAAGIAGYIDEQKIVMEMLTGFKRAGADHIITYHGVEAAKWIRQT